MAKEVFDMEQIIPNETPKKLLNMRIYFAIMILLIISGVIFIAIGFGCGYYLKASKITKETVYINSSIKPVVTTANSGEASSTEQPSTTTNKADANIWDNLRLPSHFVPSHYNIIVRTFFTPSISEMEQPQKKDETSFDGDIEIDFQLTQQTNEILFHADKNIKVLDIIRIVNLGNNQEVQVRDQQHMHKPNQYYYIKLDKPLPTGKYRLIMSFESDVDTLFGNTGLFAVNYMEDNNINTMLATSFKPSDARKVFPCFDEPQLLATFDITIEHPVGSYALSNFPVKSVQKQNDRFNSDSKIITKFETTFQMSTYLLAWSVLPDSFAYKSVQTQNGKEIRVYARNSTIQRGLVDYSLDEAKNVINYYENNYFFNSDALPPKIDLIAIPEYFVNSVEYWGLIGFRETHLLYSDKYHSVAEKQKVALTIAFSIVHFWFGNMVTARWWTDHWFNEGISSFLKYKAINAIHPDWSIDEQSIVLDILPAMFDDGFPSSHPLKVDINRPEEIHSLIDSVTHGKGAAIFRMFESVVGEEGFQNSVKEYLQQFKFQFGDTDQFFSGTTLPDKMKTLTNPVKFIDSWVKQINYPEVNVVLKPFKNGENNQSIVIFEQSRFLLSEFRVDNTSLKFDSPDDAQWEIYIQCKAGGTVDADGVDHLKGDDIDFTYFLNSQVGTVILYRQVTWVKCNKDFKGFYVTDYASDIFDIVTDVLKVQTNKFSVGDRANLLHVTYQLAFLGSKTYETPAILSSYLDSVEADYVPWKVFTHHIDRLANLLEQQAVFHGVASFAASIAKNLEETLGDLWNGDSGTHTQKLLKSTIVEFLCKLQDDSYLQTASELFNKIPSQYFYSPILNDNPVSPNIRFTVYKRHLENTYNYKDWYTVNGALQALDDPQEQAYVLDALTYSRSTWTLDSFLQGLLVKDSLVRRQDFFTVLNSMSSNPNGRHIVWYFIRQNWDQITKMFNNQKWLLSKSLRTVCETFDNRFLYQSLVEFFADKPEFDVDNILRQQTIQVVLNNVFWINDRIHDLETNLPYPM